MRTADRMRNEGLRESQAALSPSKGAIRSSRYELTVAAARSDFWLATWNPHDS